MLKTDVQGFELEVLRGASDQPAKNVVRFVDSEVGFRRGEGEIRYFGDPNDRLLGHGFMLCGFYEHFRRADKMRHFGFCNALYRNPASAGH